jgi:UDPglucose 6-dehydrogenase
LRGDKGVKICIIGTGYVGLVAGAGLADFGNEVTCYDKDLAKIDYLKTGGVPIYEIGLSDLMRRNIEKKRLKFSSNLKTAVNSSRVIFLAVGTPESGNGKPDLSDLIDVSMDLGNYILDYKVVAIKSTVPIGTHKIVREAIAKNAKGSFDVVSNPEFLREGSAVQDFLIPNRIVLGVPSEQAGEIMREVYRGLFLSETPMIITDNTTAEIIKYASNCFLATKISFINEFARLCDHFQADIVTVAKAIGMDGRIGPKFLHPSPGFGGSCLVKDMAALISMGNELDLELAIPQAVQKINHGQRQQVISKAKALLGGDANGKKIAILGLSFKSNTDDIRNSPSITVIESLLAQGADIAAYDPAAMANFQNLFPKIRYAGSAYEACQDAELTIIMTEWNEFRELDLKFLRTCMKGNALLDPRNLYLPEFAKKVGFRYAGFGRN